MGHHQFDGPSTISGGKAIWQIYVLRLERGKTFTRLQGR